VLLRGGERPCGNPSLGFGQMTETANGSFRTRINIRKGHVDKNFGGKRGGEFLAGKWSIKDLFVSRGAHTGFTPGRGGGTKSYIVKKQGDEKGGTQGGWGLKGGPSQ